MKKYFKNIDDAILNHIKEGDEDYINDVLADEHIDSIAYNPIAEKYVKKIQFLAKAKASMAHDERLLKVASTLKEGIEKGLERPIALIKSLIEKKELSFQFRNLEKLGDDEIKEIIKGHNLLNILEDLEEKDNDDSLK